MLRHITKLLSGHNKVALSLVFMVVIGSVFLLFDTGKAHAVWLGGIPTDIQNTMANFDAGNCYSGSAQYAAQTEMWLWYQNSYTDGAAGSPLQLQPGQQISLNIQTMDFVCHMATAANQTFYGFDTSQYDDNPEDSNVNTSNGQANGYINSPWWPYYGDAEAQQTRFIWGEPQAYGGGSVVSGIGGDSEQDICFQGATRYWYPGGNTCPGNIGGGASSFTYQAPTVPGTYEVEVQLPIYGASYFSVNDGVTECLANGGAQHIPDLSYTNYCTPYYASLYIEINVQTPFNNVSTLTAYPGYPSSGDVQRNQVLGFVPGMYNTGSEAGPGTYVELRAYSNYNDVTNYGSVTASGDPYVWTDGYNSGCMASGEGCVPHYYWGRTADPPYGQNDWSVQYQPTYYQVSSSANPGDLICFHNAVTPASASNYGATYSGSLCYNVFVNLQCGVSATSVSNPSPGQPFSITLGMSPTIGPGPLPNSAEGKMTALINGVSYSVVYSNGQWSVNLPSGLSPGSYTISWSFSAYSGSYVSSVSGCGGSFLVTAKPYIRVFGGDVFAGSDSTNIESCYDTSAGIYGYNSGTYNSDTGSGSTGAVLATGEIGGFASAQNADNVAGLLDPLTFSNNPNSAGSYGGNFGTTSCGDQIDYYTAVSNTPGATVCPSTISAMTLGPGDKYICYSTSPVAISGNITYADLNYADPSDLPVFEVVVRGANLTIDTGVTKLAGNYISELYNTKGGIICDTSNCTVDEPGSPDNTENTTNEDRLVVDGAFIANQVKLYRSAGTLSDDSPISSPPDSYDAEEFDYSPIDWLAPSSTTQAQVPSITSLPPVY